MGGERMTANALPAFSVLRLLLSSLYIHGNQGGLSEDAKQLLGHSMVHPTVNFINPEVEFWPVHRTTEELLSYLGPQGIPKYKHIPTRIDTIDCKML